MNYRSRRQGAVLQRPGSRTPTVLCIDDDPQVCNVIQNRLGAYEVRLLKALFGAQGVEMAATKKPDVIICDQRMPQGDGITVVECLKRNLQTAAIPIIVLSTRNEPGLQRQIEGLGTPNYVTKPIHFCDLLAELQKYIEVRLKPLDEPVG